MEARNATYGDTVATKAQYTGNRTLSFAEQKAAREAARQKPDAANAATSQPLVADLEQMRRFVDAVFKRCRDDAGSVALRAFHQATSAIVLNRWISFDEKLAEAAADAAGIIANRPTDGAAVFCPPPCLFRSGGKAVQADVMAAPVIAVDLDKADPDEGRSKLEALLGPATIVIASGGLWIGPDGSEKDRLHLYWRLARPARSTEEIELCNSVRKAAAKLVGGDATASSPVHPMRWPGSWHIKGKPRLCRIIGGDADREIELAEAARRLEIEIVAAAAASNRLPGNFSTRTPLNGIQLQDIARNLPNSDLDWGDWNERLMAFYDASHDSDEGQEAARTWSAKSAKHDDETFDDRWDHISRHPPSRFNAASLQKFVQAAQSGTEGELYVIPQAAAMTDEMRRQLKALWPDNVAGNSTFSTDPADIFGHETSFDLRDPPPGVLPDMLARWVRSEARRKGASQAFTAASAITVLAAAIGASLRIQVRQKDRDFTEPAALWCALVAEPGSAKSPVIGAAIRPIKRIDAEWQIADEPRYREWQRLAKAQKKAYALPNEPRRRRAFVDDITSERQIAIHAQNPRGLLRSTDELAGMLEALGAYKRSGGGDRATMLRLFDGESVTVDRVSSGNLFAKHALMTALAGTQPEKLRPIVRDMQSDGLLQRFIFVLDDGARIAPIDEEPDTDAAAWYERAVKYLLNVEYLLPDPVKMSDSGYAKVRGFAAELEALKDIPGTPGAWRGHLAKWEKIAARVILVFHVAEQFDFLESVDPALQVSADTVERALKFCRFLLRHSLAFYSEYFDADQSHSEAVGLAGYLLTHPEISELRRRDIYQARGSLKGADNQRKLFDVARSLEYAGWLSVVQREADGPTTWRVNPEIHLRFSRRAEFEAAERSRRRESILKAGIAKRNLLEGSE